jgi:hypothetical protein
MFHRPDMPIGGQSVPRWRMSKSQLIDAIFGP